MRGALPRRRPSPLILESSLMNRFFPHPWGWASVAPVACAIHCVATPLLVAVAPAFAVGETAEWVLFGLTLGLVAWALTSGLRRHGNVRPAIVILPALGVWMASLLHVFHPIPEEATTALAALVVAGGLIWNARMDCATGEVAACSECSVHGAAQASGAPSEIQAAAPTGAEPRAEAAAGALPH
jgi:hypothetical protein